MESLYTYVQNKFCANFPKLPQFILEFILLHKIKIGSDCKTNFQMKESKCRTSLITVQEYNS